MQLGPAEVLVILVVALLVFGPNRLPEIGRQVGRGIRELRNFQDSLRRDIDEVLAGDGTESEVATSDQPPTLPPKAVESPAPEPPASDPPAPPASPPPEAP